MLFEILLSTLAGEAFTRAKALFQSRSGQKSDSELLRELRDTMQELRQQSSSVESAREWATTELLTQTFQDNAAELNSTLNRYSSGIRGNVGHVIALELKDRVAESVTTAVSEGDFRHRKLDGVRVTHSAEPSMKIGIGDTLCSGYTIVEQLGVGGFGVTYLAENILGKHVAVKVPHHQRQFSELLEEGKLAGQLTHPNVIGIQNAIAAPPHLICEYFAGSSIRQILESRGTLPNEMCAIIVVQTLQALEHAHAQNVVHLDLKPDNILVAENPVAVKIIDFGVGKVISATERALTKCETPMTKIWVAGSLEYMAPEQRGTEQDVGPRADFYALGITIFEMVNGCIPRGSVGLGSESKELNRLFDRCYQFNPESRLSSASEGIGMMGSFATPESPGSKVEQFRLPGFGLRRQELEKRFTLTRFRPNRQQLKNFVDDSNE